MTTISLKIENIRLKWNYLLKIFNYSLRAFFMLRKYANDVLLREQREGHVRQKSARDTRTVKVKLLLEVPARTK